MTPERKALKDYGIALGELKRLRKELIFNLAHYRGIKKNGAILIFRKCLGKRAVLIKDAWQKRAACRAWVPLIRRDCHNCTYQGITPVPDFCFPCINEGIPINWEPRKEGV
ncbi:hypothetical protein CXU21_00805 [Akkermansia muciniphila]|nr:hypothetical protein CXU21_00805 [Akkermansia muciniphila]